MTKPVTLDPHPVGMDPFPFRSLRYATGYPRHQMTDRLELVFWALTSGIGVGCFVIALLITRALKKGDK